MALESDVHADEHAGDRVAVSEDCLAGFIPRDAAGNANIGPVGESVSGTGERDVIPVRAITGAADVIANTARELGCEFPVRRSDQPPKVEYSSRWATVGTASKLGSADMPKNSCCPG